MRDFAWMHRSRSILGTLAREPATSLLDHTTFPVQAVEPIPYPIKWEPPPVFSGSAETIGKGSSQRSGLAVTSPVRVRTAVPGNPCLVNTLRSSPGGSSPRPLSTAARSPAPHSSWHTRDQPHQVHSPRHGIPTRTPGPRLSGPGSRLDSPDFRDGFDLVPAGGPGLSTRNGTEGSFPGPFRD